VRARSVAEVITEARDGKVNSRRSGTATNGIIFKSCCLAQEPARLARQTLHHGPVPACRPTPVIAAYQRGTSLGNETNLEIASSSCSPLNGLRMKSL
jgi:hypothetical protein